MNNIITVGIKGYSEQLVAPKDTAAVYGSGLVEVYATPAMIALMEMAAHQSVARHLPEGTVTVGSEISVKHLKATALGRKVRAESMLVAIDGKRLDFEIEAWDESGRIGYGTHTRYVVDLEKFMSKLL